MFGLVSQRRYDTILEINRHLQSEIGVSNYSQRRFEVMLDNANKYPDHFYSIFDDVYVFCHMPQTLTKLLICTVNLSKPSCLAIRQEVCSSQIEISENTGRLEIVNIKTPEAEQRKGHGSKMISHIERLAKQFQIKEIHGELLYNTNIGIHNLQRFYEKNGYDIAPEDYRGFQTFKKTIN